MQEYRVYWPQTSCLWPFGWSSPPDGRDSSLNQCHGSASLLTVWGCPLMCITKKVFYRDDSGIKQIPQSLDRIVLTRKTPGAAQGWRRTRDGNRTFQPSACDTNPEDGYMDVAVCSILPYSGQEAGDIKGFQGSPPSRWVPRGWRLNPLALEVQEGGLRLLSALNLLR